MGSGLSITEAHLEDQSDLDDEPDPERQLLVAQGSLLDNPPQLSYCQIMGMEPDAPSHPTGEAPGRILVVDDIAINRLILQESLLSEGYVVQTAEHGREALDLLEAQPFDVVLLDLLMPEMDGYEVLSRMKATASLQHLPVIVVSALDEMDSVIRCIEMGATDYLTRPFDPVLLRARINASLASKRMHDMKQRYVSKIERLAQELKVRNRFIKKIFGRYLSEEIVTNLLDSPGGLELGGEKRRLTLLMSDIRGFSSISERLPPEQVVRLINNYLGTMADVIMEHSGTIDEFIGDAILGFFGAPIARPDDARRALACALTMQHRMVEVNRINRDQGLPEVEMGIAINTGEVVIGNIGSFKRTKYGAVGSHVNLTARIESFSVGGQILISDATLHEAGADVAVGESREIVAKGFEGPIRVHELVGLAGDRDLLLPHTEHPLYPLERAVRIEITLLEDKLVKQRTHIGELVRLSSHGAELRTSALISPLADIKIRWFDAEGRELSTQVYAKVLKRSAEDGALYRIRFTSLPPEVASLCDALASEP